MRLRDFHWAAILTGTMFYSTGLAFAADGAPRLTRAELNQQMQIAAQAASDAAAVEPATAGTARFMHQDRVRTSKSDNGTGNKLQERNRNQVQNRWQTADDAGQGRGYHDSAGAVGRIDARPTYYGQGYESRMSNSGGRGSSSGHGKRR